MALLEVNLQPSARDLRWFGVVMLLFVWFVGALIWWATGATAPVAVLGAVGVVLCAVYYLVKPLRRLLYVGWMRAIYPIGWVMSHLLIGVVFFGVITPIGWLLRLLGSDPMRRTLVRDARTYWVEREDKHGAARYFRQF